MSHFGIITEEGWEGEGGNESSEEAGDEPLGPAPRFGIVTEEDYEDKCEKRMSEFTGKFRDVLELEDEDL